MACQIAYGGPLGGTELFNGLIGSDTIELEILPLRYRISWD
ncbi:hypothetical protein I553_9146 [Mycobacterium xenopi 4042]|uniref:Uncharacterized protein n=1 Tax=Mycobacterium xenopi 4042 TaxID=1299334 RepID=X8E5K3_MYCXE|nr:hypothetical protein I553_9146 [Mycobacterium xenopi 4042]